MCTCPHPPSVGRGLDKKSWESDKSTSVSDEVFFLARSTPHTRTPTSSFYLSSSFTCALTERHTVSRVAELCQRAPDEFVCVAGTAGAT